MDDSPESLEQERLQLLLRERGWLRGLARQIVGAREGVDDAVHDALAAAWLQTARGDGRPGPRGTWRGLLAAILKNQLAGRRREEHRRRAREAAAARAEAEPPASDVVARFEVQRDVATAVLALPEPYRTTVLLRFYDRLSPGAIARRLGVPVETVRTRQKRAFVLLRERLDARHGGDRRAWAVPLVLAARTGQASATPLLLGVLLMTTFQKTVCTLAAALAAVWLCVAPPWSPPPALAPSSEPGASAAALAHADASSGDAAGADAAGADAERGASRTEVAAAQGVRPFVVRGVVVDDETGLPIGGATARLRNLFPAGIDGELAATTGADGAFAIADERVAASTDDPRFRHELTVSAPDHATLRTTFVTEVANANAPTDPSGGAGMAAAKAAADAGEAGRDAGANGHDAGTLRLVAGTWLAGRVVDREGRGVAGAELMLCIDRTHWGAAEPEQMLRRVARLGRSGARGAFRLDEPVSPSIEHGGLLFAVAPQGIGWCRFEPSATRREVGDLVVALRPTGAVRLLVRDEAGRPVAGARVVAMPCFGPLGICRRDARGPISTHGDIASRFVRTTGIDGMAEFAELPVGEPFDRRPAGLTERSWSFRVEAADHPEQPPLGLELLPDGLCERTIDLLPARAVTVVATLVDDLGVPVVDATVEVTGGGATTHARTDAAGRAELTARAVEKLHVAASAPRHRRAGSSVELAPDGVRVEASLVLARTQPLDVRVVDQFGAPAAGMSLFVDDRPLGSTDADGRCHVAEFPAGPRQLVVALGVAVNRAQWTGRYSPETVDAAAGPVTVVMQRRPGDVDVQVAVVDAASGAPLEPMASALSLFLEDRARFLPIVTPEAERGLLRAEHLPAGRYRIDVRTASGQRGSLAFELELGQPAAELRLPLATSGTITGRLRFVGVAPPAEVAVWVSHERRAPQSYVQFRYPGRWRAEGPGQRVVTEEHGGTGQLRLQPALATTFRLEHADPDEPLVFVVTGPGIAGRATFRVAPGATFDGTIDVTGRNEK